MISERSKNERIRSRLWARVLTAALKEGKDDVDYVLNLWIKEVDKLEEQTLENELLGSV